MDTTLVDEKIKELYLSYRTIAIVGASPDSKKTSNIIMKYLRNTGYKVFPVNPVTDNKIIHGEPVYKKLTDIKDHVGIVNVFRPSEEAEEIAKQTIEIGANVLKTNTIDYSKLYNNKLLSVILRPFISF